MASLDMKRIKKHYKDNADQMPYRAAILSPAV